MTAVAQRLHLRLFLEGVECPVVSATITSQKNAAATASIQIPANDYGLDLKPRTLVHLFFFDAYHGEASWVGGEGIRAAPRAERLERDPDAAPMVPSETAPAPDPALAQIDAMNDQYKLLFGGEVIGVAYQKDPASRAMVLQCVDWSSYWDIAYQYQVSGMSLAGGGIKAAFTGANTTVFNQFLEGSGDIVLKLLSTPPRSYPRLQGSLLGGIMHLIEAIGGCYYGGRAVKGSNDFFSLAEMRLHITQMVAANPNSAQDEMRLLRANGFGTLFSKALQGLGKLVTIRQVLLALQRYIFHEVVPITAPYYRPARGDHGPTLETVPLGQDSTTAPLVRAAEELKSRALELKERQEATTDAKASEVQSTTHGDLGRELDKLAGVATAAQARTKEAQRKTGAASASGGLVQVAAAFETASRQFAEVREACWSVGDTYSFPSTGTVGAARVVRILQAVAESMQLVLDAKYARPPKRAVAQPDDPQRLYTQVYRPDVWMVAPPRCNVIFPELYSQFSYSRQFLNEVSRILLRTHEAFYGSDLLFDGFYMAPSRLLGARKGKPMGTGRTNIEPAHLSDAPAWVVRDMLDHELYTGITPTFERMSDLNLHAIRGGSIEINGARVGYAQLVCNHVFFQQRFRARELMCSGRFNPYAVPGFPAVIIDKYLTDDEMAAEVNTAKARELADLTTPLPSNEQASIAELNAAQVAQASAIMQERPLTHFLGTPELISHSVSANAGGTTQYQMSYARTTNEKTEFLGDNLGKSATAKRTRNQTVSTVVAALEAPTVGTQGIRGGRITTVTDVTLQYAKRGQTRTVRSGDETYTTYGTTLPLFVSEHGFSGRKRRGTQVPVGIELPATAYGPEVVAIAGAAGNANAALGDVLVTFKAFRIVEEVGVYERKDVELPPEELTFPPWYGEAYRTNKIGALYAEFFGTGAITDPTVVLGSGDARHDTSGERALYVEFQERGLGGQPPPGLSETPEPSGGGTFGPPGAPDEEVMGEIEARSPLKDAIDELVRIYAATRVYHYDTPAFVQTYTWRPIASMIDLFGTADLRISDTGVVLSGREGFHSRSFGDYDDLRQLVGPGADGQPQTVLGLAAKPHEINGDITDPSAKIAARMDTRKEKRLAVLRYLNALANSRGVLLG